MSEVEGNHDCQSVEECSTSADSDTTSLRPPPIMEVQWPHRNTANTDMQHDEDDLTLWLGAEHELHRVVQHYRDLSSVTFDDVALIVADEEKQYIFPVLLHHILSSNKFEDSIAWLQNGRAFVIVNMEKFCSEVCPWYFCTYEFGPLMRWLERYGFQKMIIYAHELRTEALFAFYHEVRDGT